MSCKIFTFIYLYHRHRAYVCRAQFLSPVCLLSYVLPHARLVPFISHLGAYIFARRTRLRHSDVGTKDNRRMSCNVRNRVAQRHTAAFFHANLMPSPRRSSTRRLCKKVFAIVSRNTASNMIRVRSRETRTSNFQDLMINTFEKYI